MDDLIKQMLDRPGYTKRVNSKKHSQELNSNNSLSRENDPHFEVITPICKVCKNSENKFKCKKYGTRPKEYGYGKKYDCPYLNLDKSSLSYKYIKEKLKIK